MPCSGLPQRAGALLRLIHVLDVSRSERLHQLRNGADSQRCDEQMNVVRHQRVRVQEHTKAYRCLGKPLQVDLEVPFVEEAWPAIVSTLHDVQRQIGHQKTRAARHARKRVR